MFFKLLDVLSIILQDKKKIWHQNYLQCATIDKQNINYQLLFIILYFDLVILASLIIILITTGVIKWERDRPWSWIRDI